MRRNHQSDFLCRLHIDDQLELSVAPLSTPMHIPEGKIVLTYEDYVLLPNDRNRYEILEGELA